MIFFCAKNICSSHLVTIATSSVNPDERGSADPRYQLEFLAIPVGISDGTSAGQSITGAFWLSLLSCNRDTDINIS